jgi:hypothetical protein
VTASPTTTGSGDVGTGDAAVDIKAVQVKVREVGRHGADTAVDVDAPWDGGVERDHVDVASRS